MACIITQAPIRREKELHKARAAATAKESVHRQAGKDKPHGRRHGSQLVDSENYS
jgi:hypothetical protein